MYKSEIKGYNEWKVNGTGSAATSINKRLVICRINEYEVVVKIGDNGEFLAVTEVRVNKSFLSEGQKKHLREGENLDDFYKDDSE